jgi:drug/metabolite transporter (DMT)-like permease
VQGDVASLVLGIRRFDLWKFTVPMAILGPFLATLLWIAGFKYETPGRVAIFNQLSTVFVVLWAWLILKEPMTRKKLAGISLAFGGAVLVAWG